MKLDRRLAGLGPERDRRSLITRTRAGLNSLRRIPDVESLRDAGVSIGNLVALHRGVSLDKEWGWLISLGESCILAPGVIVLAHDASTRRSLGYTKIAPVHIGARTFIGAASIILPGVTVGDDAIVGAGSVVSRDVPPGALAIGNPARVVGPAAEFLARRQAHIAQEPVFENLRARRADPTTWPKLRREIEQAVRAHGRGWIK
jgi:maltose O-acetyltransferase